jgi:carboxyl-terminal processing protease
MKRVKLDKIDRKILKNLQDNKKDIIELLSHEIIQRYYFQKGEIQYSLRDDMDLKTTLEKLNNKDEFASLLMNK